MKQALREMVLGVEAVLCGLATTARLAWENLTTDDAIVTRTYPEIRTPVASNYRGHLINDIARCYSCRMCEKACPIDCIVIEAEPAIQGPLRPSRFDIDLSKCIYCGLCARACPTGSLRMGGGYEMEPRLLDGRRYLLRQRPDQVGSRLDSAQTARLHDLLRLDPATLNVQDRAFMATQEDPAGNCLIARFGPGFLTSEERAEVNRIKTEKKKARESAPPPPGGST